MKNRGIVLAACALATALAGCASLRPSAKLCPAPDQDPSFWYRRTGFSDQAAAEHWTLAKACAAMAGDGVAGAAIGTAPFYFIGDDGEPCLCPVR